MSQPARLASVHNTGCQPALAMYQRAVQHAPNLIHDRSARSRTFSLVLLAVTDLLGGALSTDVPHAMLQGAYAALTGTRATARAQDIPTAWALDPVGPLLGPGAGSPEQRLVIRACDYLDARERSGRPDFLAAQLFWQAVRIRTILYRYVTQRPLTPGLPWFIRFYARLMRARGDVQASLLLKAAAQRSGLPEGLSSLEMRTRPDAAMEELLAWVRSAGHRSGTGNAELGFVFHFVKERGGEVSPGVPWVNASGTTADPSANACGYRYSNFFAAQRAAAITLARLLHGWPRTLHVVRGMDVAADELAVPARVFRPLGWSDDSQGPPSPPLSGGGTWRTPLRWIRRRCELSRMPFIIVAVARMGIRWSAVARVPHPGVNSVSCIPSGPWTRALRSPHGAYL